MLAVPYYHRNVPFIFGEAMRKLIDLTGKKFGRLTVIKRNYPNNKYNRTMWLCKCDCGKEKVILGCSLKGGKTRSCGCLKKKLLIKLNKNKKIKHNKLALGVASMKSVIDSYKRNAKKRGIEYNLTEEQFKEITQKDCYYCGAKPNNVAKRKGCNGRYIYNGIDRIDNTRGYTADNVTSCCHLCNSAKGKLTMQEFRKLIKKVYNNLKRKEM